MRSICTQRTHNANLKFSVLGCAEQGQLMTDNVSSLRPAPDVIEDTWYPMCDGHATQIFLVNGVALICPLVEAYWFVKRVPHCSATDVVVLHPMH